MFRILGFYLYKHFEIISADIDYLIQLFEYIQIFFRWVWVLCYRIYVISLYKYNKQFGNKLGIYIDRNIRSPKFSWLEKKLAHVSQMSLLRRRPVGLMVVQWDFDQELHQIWKSCRCSSICSAQAVWISFSNSCGTKDVNLVIQKWTAPKL